MSPPARITNGRRGAATCRTLHRDCSSRRLKGRRPRGRNRVRRFAAGLVNIVVEPASHGPVARKNGNDLNAVSSEWRVVPPVAAPDPYSAKDLLLTAS